MLHDDLKDIYEPVSCMVDCEQYLLHMKCNCTLSGPLKALFEDGRKCNLTDILQCQFARQFFEQDRWDVVDSLTYYKDFPSESLLNKWSTAVECTASGILVAV